MATDEARMDAGSADHADAGRIDADAGGAEERASPSASMGRRAALKVLGTVAAGVPVAGAMLGAADAEAQARPGAAGTTQPPAAAARTPPPPAGPRGTPSDPDLLRPRKDWPRKLSAGELTTLTALVDVIIPADERSPSASAVGVPAWINEYVSYPAEAQQRDLVRVRGGLAWLDAESRRRFGALFARLTGPQQAAICDDICFLPEAKPEFRAAARFFDLVRDLSAVGFYTTDAGMKDLGYVGNVALPRFDGPPPEVLRHLGLE
jgi:hypothetical protein